MITCKRYKLSDISSALKKTMRGEEKLVVWLVVWLLVMVIDFIVARF